MAGESRALETVPNGLYELQKWCMKWKNVSLRRGEEEVPCQSISLVFMRRDSLCVNFTQIKEEIFILANFMSKFYTNVHLAHF